MLKKSILKGQANPSDPRVPGLRPNPNYSLVVPEPILINVDFWISVGCAIIITIAISISNRK